jgi:serine/threonine protein kinase
MAQRPEKIEFLDRIGSGGMADVFRARLIGTAGFSKTVVVKRLKQRYRHIPEVVAMFVEEARLSAEVQHRNIVQVYEFLENGEELWIVMEYVPGSDLRRALKMAAKRGLRVPAWLSVHILSEVLEGLVYAHELVDERGNPRNIIHRDVAPDNIYLSTHGDVKLGDFGIAQQGTTTTPELDDHVKGKLPYMAPELFEGKGFDRRIDVFAASVVLWECLTQRRLFKRKTNVEMIRAVCLDQRVPPSAYARDIPKELDRLVLAGLEIDPKKRLGSAQVMQASLLDMLRRMKPQLHSAEVRGSIRALLDEQSESAEELIIDVVEEEGVVTERSPGRGECGERTGCPEPSVPPAPVIELSPWDVASDSGVWSTPTPSVDVPTDPGDRTPPPMLLDSWESGNYAIVRGRAVAPLPRSPRQTTDDLLKKNPTPIPGPGRPGDRETGDILRQYVLEPFAGEAGPPYYLRTDHGELGPLYFTEVMEKIRAYLELRSPTASIGSDGMHWMPVPNFLELTGQEIGEPATFLPRGTVSGSLSGRSIISLLGEIARKQGTGRLVVAKSSLPPSARREVHFFQGLPTHVGAEEADLQPPHLLVQHGLVGQNQLDECLRVVIAEQRPLEFVLSQRSKMDVDRYRAFVMTMRLETLFEWTTGHFAFDALTPPKSTRPFAESIYRLMPLLVDRTRNNRELERAVAPYLDWIHIRSADFDEIVSHLTIGAEEIDWLRTVGQFQTIGEWLLSAPVEERTALILAHLLIELGLLRRSNVKAGSQPDFQRPSR